MVDQDRRKRLHAGFKLTRQQIAVICGALAVLLVCLLLRVTWGDELLSVVTQPERFRSWLDGFGAFDELVFILIRAAQTVIKFNPAEPLEIASGYAWGPFHGMLYCILGNMLETVVIFAMTRRCGKKVIKLFAPEKITSLLNTLSYSDRIYWILFLLYLIPGSPKDGMTYLAGLLPVKLTPFLLITFIARIPSVLSSAICGASIAEQQYRIAILIFALTAVLSAAGGFFCRVFTKRKEQLSLGKRESDEFTVCN